MQEDPNLYSRVLYHLNYVPPRTHIYTCTDIHRCMHTHTCIHTYMHAYIHAYIHAFIHTSYPHA